jgi:hypothetical protein
MTKNLFRNCMMVVLGVAAAQMSLSAQGRGALEGVWFGPVDGGRS